MDNMQDKLKQNIVPDSKVEDWFFIATPEERAQYAKDKPRVTFVQTGNITEITTMDKRNDHATIKRLDKDTYIVLSDDTETPRKFNLSENRGQNADGIKRTMRKLRLLINNNFTGAPSELFVTLTYRDGVRGKAGLEQLYQDFDKFIKRLRYYCQHKHENAPIIIEYLCCVEPHASGCFHAHVLLRGDCKRLYIPNAKMEELWGQGFTKTQSLTKVDNVGAYLSAYLSNIPVSDDVEGENVVEKNGKKYVKGARLHFYPRNTRLIRHSKGIITPTIIKNMPLSRAMEYVDGHTLTHTWETVIETDTFKSTVHKEFYNKKRRPNNDEK